MKWLYIHIFALVLFRSYVFVVVLKQHLFSVNFHFPRNLTQHILSRNTSTSLFKSTEESYVCVKLL